MYTKLTPKIYKGIIREIKDGLWFEPAALFNNVDPSIKPEWERLAAENKKPYARFFKEMYAIEHNKYRRRMLRWRRKALRDKFSRKLWKAHMDYELGLSPEMQWDL